MSTDTARYKEVVDNAKDLPTLSAVVTRLNEMVKNPSTSATDIGDLISQDIALTSKTLKLVNSSFYGFPKKINSITHAIVILGFNKVKNIALAASVMDAMQTPEGDAFDTIGFWTHSIGVATGTEILAKSMKSDYLEDAFVAGLLHDLGKLVINTCFPDEYSKVMKLIDRSNIPMFEAENEIFGFNHSLPGLWLTEKWNFPSSLCQAIRMHHNPLMARQHKDLVWLVHMGDVFVRALGIGNGGDPFIPELDEKIWDKMNLTTSGVDTILGDILTSASKADDFLDLVRKQKKR